MDVYEAILRRRSIRLFTNQLVSDDILTKLLEAAMAAPSAKNRQPWKFYVIKNKEILNKLSDVFKDFNAQTMIIVAGDMSKLEDKSMFWIQDCAAATQNILLAAEGFNIGTCWCGVYPKESETTLVKEILNLEEKIIPLALIQLGYKALESEPRTQYDKENVVIIGWYYERK